MASGRVGDAVVGVLQAAGADRVRDPGHPHARALRRPGRARRRSVTSCRATNRARPSPPTGTPGSAACQACARRRPDPARSTRSRRSPRPGRTRRPSSSSPARSMRPSMVPGHGILHETPDQGRSFEAITSFVGRPRTPEAIPAAVAEALRCSMTGRWRPAYVELPTDLLLAAIRGRAAASRAARTGPA